MYIFEFMDGTYRIDRFTNSTIPFGALLRNAEAMALYDGAYATDIDARKAMYRIKELLAA